MKSDYQRVQPYILIGYSSDTTKHFCMWASQTKEVVIASQLFIDKSEKGAKLLVKWLLDPMQLKKKALIGEPRPKRRPQKNRTESRVKTREKLRVEPPNSTMIGAENNIKGQDVVISLTKTNSKIYKPKS